MYPLCYLEVVIRVSLGGHIQFVYHRAVVLVEHGSLRLDEGFSTRGLHVCFVWHACFFVIFS
jgi:hypothetical protein